MDAKQVRQGIPKLKDALQSLNVRSLSLFGSTARGEAREGSDLDFLVEFEGPATFDRYMELKELLEDAFHSQVDLVTQNALRSVLREQILKGAIRLA